MTKPLLLIPINIRNDLVIEVKNIPYDLTIEEADKISKVVKSYAQPTKEATND